MKKLLSVLLAAAVLLCALASLAEQDEPKEDRFSVLRIRVPTVPPVRRTCEATIWACVLSVMRKAEAGS